MSIKKVMVIGAGQMGSSIAQVCAQSGYDVMLNDMNDEALNKGVKNIEKHLARSAEKERFTSKEKDEVLNRLTHSQKKEDAADHDIIIEEDVENMDVKAPSSRKLENITPKEVMLATYTSSLPITEIAAVTERPEKVIGMHYMNPVPVMKLVEVIRGLQTSEETFDAVMDMAGKLNKTSVEVNDSPAFVANRILMPMINEAIFTVYEGVASPEDVDTVMRSEERRVGKA